MKLGRKARQKLFEECPNGHNCPYPPQGAGPTGAAAHASTHEPGGTDEVHDIDILDTGVLLSAHEGRHVPGGADALPVGVPVAVGDANAAGSATDFVRSDHVHQRSRTDSAVIVVAANNSLNPNLADSSYRCDGVADQVEINAAISAVAPVGGMVVLLDGQFNIADNQSINGASNVTLLGQGRGTLIINTTANFDLIVATTLTGFVVGMMRLQGRNYNAVFCCIRFNDCSYSLIFQVWTVDSGVGIYFGDNGCDHCIIYSSYITTARGIGAGGISFSAVTGNRNYRNLIIGCHIYANSSFGIWFGDYNMQNGFYNCEIYANSRWGVNIYGSSNDDNVFVGNIINNNSQNGFYATDGRRNIFAANKVYYNSWNTNPGAVYINAYEGWIICNNTVTHNTGHGIQVAGSSHHCVIMGNYCQDNDRDNTATYDGIIVSSSYNLIVANRCYNNDRYEINIAGGTRNKVFHNNLYGTDHVACFNDAGTDTELPEIQGVIDFGQATVAIGDGFGVNLPNAADTSVRINFNVPSEFIQLVRCRVLVIPLATGNMAYSVATDFGKRLVEVYTTHSGSIALTTQAVTLNVIGGINVDAALSGLDAGDFVLMTFTRNATDVNDTVEADCVLVGAYLQYV